MRQKASVEGTCEALDQTQQQRNADMKVINSQKSDKTDDGISRETLNDWQRKDAAKKADEAKRRDSDSKDARK
jgi:hypothetical protein